MNNKDHLVGQLTSANLAFINDLNVTSPLQCIKGHDHCASSRSSLYAEGRPGKQHKLSLGVGWYVLYIAPPGLWCLICKILTFINVNIAIICRYINYQYILSIYRALQEATHHKLCSQWPILGLNFLKIDN